MTICVNCQGQGHSSIIGDNDIECKVCGGTGEQPDFDITPRHIENPDWVNGFINNDDMSDYSKFLTKLTLDHMTEPNEEQPVNTVATVEQLSEEAQLRLQLDTMDKAWNEVHDIRTVRLYNGIKADFDLDLSDKLHMLLNLLDAERQENARLIAKLNDAYYEGWNDGAEAYGEFN